MYIEQTPSKTSLLFLLPTTPFLYHPPPLLLLNKPLQSYNYLILLGIICCYKSKYLEGFIWGSFCLEMQCVNYPKMVWGTLN